MDKFRGLSREASLALILQVVKNNRLYSNEEQAAMINKKNEYYQELFTHKEKVNLLPGTIDFIKILRSQGIKIALASTSRNSLQLLKLHEIDELFDYVVNPNEVTHQKPDPEIFTKAIEYFNLKPNECWGVEDALVGVQAINAAKAYSIGIGELKNIGAANLVLASTKALNYEQILNHYNQN